MIDTKEIRPVVEAAGLNGISMEEVLELLDRLEAAEKEREELHALIAAVKKQANAEYRIRVKKEEECALLQAKISDLTINVEYLGNLKKSYEELIGELQDDRDALRAKIEQMEKQEPTG